jgi:hypothetical protein
MAKPSFGRSLRAGETSIAEVRALAAPFGAAKHYLTDATASYAYDTVVVDGDLEITGDLDTLAHELCNLVVTGSLRVSGLYRDYDDPQTAVFVLGDMTADRVITSGALCVRGDLTVRGALVGYYNDHVAEIHGNVTAHVFAPENHGFGFDGTLTVEHVIGAGAEYRVPPKLRRSATPVADAVLRELVVPEILEIEDYGDPEETPEINVDHPKVRERVAKGLPLLAAAGSNAAKPTPAANAKAKATAKPTATAAAKAKAKAAAAAKTKPTAKSKTAARSNAKNAVKATATAKPKAMAKATATSATRTKTAAKTKTAARSNAKNAQVRAR